MLKKNECKNLKQSSEEHGGYNLWIQDDRQTDRQTEGWTDKQTHKG